MTSFKKLLTLGLVATSVFAHPGHNVHKEALERRDFMKRSPKNVRTCSSQLLKRGHVDAAVDRRRQMANKLRSKRGLASIEQRDFAEYNISHATTKNVTLGDDETTLFDDSSSCILQPEVTQGPYYVDGELIRKDITEDQEGITLWLDVQLINVATCEPVPAVYMDLWHCNATGVYAGVVESGNGNSNDSTNLQNTFLRGIQQSDISGVVQFETIVPGHYTGRTNHIHVLTHNTNDTIVRTNGTLLAGNFTTHASHVGQLFFDQDLLSQVEETAPYSTNTQSRTYNEDDSILGEEAADMDPFVEYVLVDQDDITQGIMAWISIGIDPTADNDVTSAGTHYDGYGVANDNAMGGGSGPGGAAPSGGMPSGSMSGQMPTGSMTGSPPSGSA